MKRKIKEKESRGKGKKQDGKTRRKLEKGNEKNEEKITDPTPSGEK